MRARLLTHSHAEDEVLYRRLKSSQHEASRKFAQEGEREHQLVEQQLQKMLAADDKMSDVWMEQLTELQKLVDHHVDEEESTGFSCAREEFAKDELEAMGNRVPAPQRRADGRGGLTARRPVGYTTASDWFLRRWCLHLAAVTEPR